MQTHGILAAGLLSAALGQAAIADEHQNSQLHDCMDMAIGSVDVPGSSISSDGPYQSVAKTIQSESHIARITVQILPTSKPDERTRIEFTAHVVDESDPKDYYDIKASISFMFNDNGDHVADMGDIFDAGVWIERRNPDGTSHYDPTPRLKRDAREVWVAQSATASAFVFSHCMGMNSIMPLGYDDRSAAVPEFPTQAFE